MKRLIFLAVLGLAASACLTTHRDRQQALGPAGQQCLASDADCARSSQCCSDWCVNGVCENREP